MKKKLIFSAVAVMLVFSLFACSFRGNGGDETDADTTIAEKQIIYPAPDNNKVVILDAGHGFRDIGCDTDLLDGTEAQVNIQIVMLLKSALEEMGVRVILTHDGEEYPSTNEIISLADEFSIEYKAEDIIENDIFSAYERSIYSAAIAKKENADVFLSLHVNSIEGHPEISQYELDYFVENPYESSLQVLCEMLSEDFDNKTKISADDYENAFLVTKIGTHPSLLIEMGYATNELDAAKLNDYSWRAEFANKVARCVYEWISSYEGK